MSAADLADGAVTAGKLAAGAVGAAALAGGRHGQGDDDGDDEHAEETDHLDRVFDRLPRNLRRFPA